MKRIWKDYLTFSKKERIGIAVLLIALALFLVIPEVYKPEMPVGKIDTSSLKLFGKAPMEEKKAYYNNKTVGNYAESDEAVKEVKLFVFDPNTINEAQWLTLGIQPRTVKTIINYRNKGGKFRDATDIQKIWGISPSDAKRLMPFIHITSMETNARYSTASYRHDNVNYSQGEAPTHWQTMPRSIQAKTQEVEINTATQQEWEALPGIGPVIAKRIIKFRDKLGGFKEVAEVKKTYGISDSLFERLQPYLKLTALKPTPSASEISAKDNYGTTNGLVNINKASVGSLLSVEIPEEIAKSIVLYRKQHGSYKKIEDLRNIVFINDVIYAKIANKLTVE